VAMYLSQSEVFNHIIDIFCAKCVISTYVVVSCRASVHYARCQMRFASLIGWLLAHLAPVVQFRLAVMLPPLKFLISEYSTISTLGLRKKRHPFYICGN